MFGGVDLDKLDPREVARGRERSRGVARAASGRAARADGPCGGPDEAVERLRQPGGGEVGPEEAKEAAQQCALNAIAAVKSVVGDLDRVAQVVKVVVFVASTPDFTGQPQVANGASELLGKVFGDAGIHARSAVGVPVLPLDSPVEVEIIVRVAQ